MLWKFGPAFSQIYPAGVVVSTEATHHEFWNCFEKAGLGFRVRNLTGHNLVYGLRIHFFVPFVNL